MAASENLLRLTLEALASLDFLVSETAVGKPLQLIAPPGFAAKITSIYRIPCRVVVIVRTSPLHGMGAARRTRPGAEALRWVSESWANRDATSCVPHMCGARPS
jgi:hypothetical protein